MRKALTKAAIAGLACFATMTAGSVTPAQSLVAKQTAPVVAKKNTTSVTRFAYNANVYGTKIVLGGVEVRSLKDALINRPCTRRTGLETQAGSILSTDGLPQELQDIISFGLSRSTTQTYRQASKGVYGIRATNTLADISLGGNVLGIATPQLKLVGLKSVADSFYDGKSTKAGTKFGFADSFGYEGLELVLNDEDQISQTVQTLFDALGLDPVEELNEIVKVPLNTLLEVISELPLELPGLGSISLGQSTGSATAHGATADAYALKVTLDGIPSLGIPQTVLQLGRAASFISEPVKAGVFRSKMSALEANIGNLVRLGGVGQRSLPCEGTGNKIVTSKVAAAGIPNVLDLSAIEYKYKGVQQGSKATGFVQTTIGKVDIPVADVTLEGLVSRVDVKSLKPNKRVTSTALTKIGRLLVNGQEVTLLPGKTMEFTDASGQVGFIRRAVLTTTSNGFFGKHLTGIRIQLPGTNTTLDLGIANGEVFFR